MSDEKMTVEEFMEQFNGAPYDDQELAEVASKVEGDLGDAAEQFLDALRDFHSALDEIGFEWD